MIYWNLADPLTRMNLAGLGLATKNDRAPAMMVAIEAQIANNIVIPM